MTLEINPTDVGGILSCVYHKEQVKKRLSRSTLARPYTRYFKMNVLTQSMVEEKWCKGSSYVFCGCRDILSRKTGSVSGCYSWHALWQNKTLSITFIERTEQRRYLNENSTCDLMLHSVEFCLSKLLVFT